MSVAIKHDLPVVSEQAESPRGFLQAGAPQFRPIQELASWRRYLNGLIAAEVSRFARYFDRLIQVAPLSTDTGALFQQIDAPRKEIALQLTDLPSLMHESERRSALLISGNCNHDFDVQALLQSVALRMARTSRVVLVLYNPYLRWLYALANKLGLRQGEPPQTFLTETDLRTLAKLSGLEIVSLRPVGYVPMPLAGIGTFLNRWLTQLPLVGRFSFASVATLRVAAQHNADQVSPSQHSPRTVRGSLPSLSIIIPARNERGNIENALKRIPQLGTSVEVIFVEGHSSDGTWEEIQRVLPLYRQSEAGQEISIKAFRQTGKGKADAVRLGFREASGEVLTILDADLTMPPELLGRFYQAYVQGLGDFVNGSRLMYPMEGEAMKFLNHLGNVFFAKSLGFVMGARIGDSLCGTKLLAAHDYRRMVAWRSDFGDFDPFGDFELLFPAAVLNLGIVDVPVRYRARTYGSTNIRRFRDGWKLLKMTVSAFFRLRPGAPPPKQ